MRTFLCLTLGFGMVGASAPAQRVPVPEGPSDFKPSGSKVGAKDTRRVVQDFARCMTRRNLSAVAEFLDQNLQRLSPALRSRAPDCLGNAFDRDESMLKGSSGSFRYAFAEALVTRRYGENGLGDITTVSPLTFAKLVPGQNPGLNALAECVIRRDPAKTWALIRTEAASAEERALFRQLMPAMQACVSQGSILKMQAFFMRGAIAETYYLLSKAPRVAPKATN